MAEPSTNPAKPTQLAFALGSLQATVEAQTREQSLQRTALEDLPGKLAEHFAPRFTKLEAGQVDHNTRLIVLEGDKRFIKGAFYVVAALITIIGGKAFIFK